jgi:dihydropteroate synthase
MRPHFLLQFNQKKLELGSRTCVMGILNVTPDSFYDGGRYFSPEDAASHAAKLIDEGADILDIGAQSTRPGSVPIGPEEELKRILPVLKAIRPKTIVWISIDTYRSDVARICLSEGADMINDVSSFRMDDNMPEVLSETGAPVVCMHFLKSLHPMPADPQYQDLLEDIRAFFRETFRLAKRAGVKDEQIVLDPGIGFGKSLEHNLKIIRELSFLQEFGRPILAGPSRKSFLGKITGLPADARLEATAAAAAICILQGAHIIRVHDVLFFRRYCSVLDFLINEEKAD